MVWNKNAGYGRELMFSLGAGISNLTSPAFGRTLYVMKAGTVSYDRIADLLPVDPEGEVRLFTTVTAGMAALEDYDTLFIGPGNWDEAAKMELADLKGVKIIGTGNGMQWGEGATCIRNVVATTSDILDITGCQAIEIAGINFIQVGAYDAINFTGLNYSTHIHHCGFIGNPGTAVGLYGVHANGSNGPDTYIHDCRFFGWKTAGIVMGNQRNVVKDNVFVVPNSGHGINIPAAAVSSFNVVINNYFLGGGTSDVGIYSATSAVGSCIVAKNYFANFADNKGISMDTDDSDENCVCNYEADYGTGGGVFNQVDPEN